MAGNGITLFPKTDFTLFPKTGFFRHLTLFVIFGSVLVLAVLTIGLAVTGNIPGPLEELISYTKGDHGLKTGPDRTTDPTEIKFVQDRNDPVWSSEQTQHNCRVFEDRAKDQL